MESLGPLYEKGIRVNDIIIGVNDDNGELEEFNSIFKICHFRRRS